MPPASRGCSVISDSLRIAACRIQTHIHRAQTGQLPTNAELALIWVRTDRSNDAGIPLVRLPLKVSNNSSVMQRLRMDVKSMPAITVDNILSLPRVQELNPATSVDRPVISVTTAPTGYEGEGFPVRRAFAGVDIRALDPFIHMDQMGEVNYAPGEPKGTPWHPHRGFETVTYMIDGQMQHSDSHGGGGLITNGDTQWMTAGSGILHIETPPEHLVASGGLFHGVQLWVNLPKADKFLEPKYQDIRANNVALLSSTDGGALIRVIAGEVDGHAGPGSTHTPITLVHASISP